MESAVPTESVYASLIIWSSFLILCLWKKGASVYIQSYFRECPLITGGMGTNESVGEGITKFQYPVMGGITKFLVLDMYEGGR